MKEGAMVQRRLRALAYLGLLACTACDDCGKSSGESPKVSPQDLAAGKAKVEAIETARKAALVAAKASITARSDLGPCPVDIGQLGPPPAQGLPGSKTAWGGYDVARWSPDRGHDLLANFPDELCAIERLGIAYADEVGTKPGPRGFQLASLLGDTEPRKWQLDDLLKTENAYDFELVIDAEIPPKIVSDKEFEPGHIRARFYVWDNGKNAIVCAAKVVAESSDSLRATGPDQAQVDLQMKSGLVSDLREQALAAVKGHVYVAGPPRGEDDVMDASTADASPRDAGARK
jgi:hypothetical protein